MEREPKIDKKAELVDGGSGPEHLEDEGSHNEINLNPGDPVLVERGNGEVEGGWYFHFIDSEGRVVVRKAEAEDRVLTKKIPFDEFMVLNGR